MRRVGIAIAFAAAMMMAFAATWLLLDRAITGKVLLAMAFLALAAFIAALAAETVVALLGRRPSTARFAAAILILIVGTVGLMSALLMAQSVLASYDLAVVPAAMALQILMISGAAALYNFLTLAGLVILPFSLPIIVVFAWLIARAPR